MKSFHFTIYQLVCLVGILIIGCACSTCITNCSTQVDSQVTIVFQNVSELISSEGYPVEEYKVETTDGYILGMQRIPHGIANGIRVAGEARTGRPAVLLLHGLLASAADWVLNFPSGSLGFILADAGYDVWLGNFRGSTYSRSHKTLNPNQKKFWKFTWDEMASYDLPALIDFVLNKTNQPQLHYVGHSQGSTTVFALLSEQLEYNGKIKSVMALAPVATTGFIRSPIRFLAPFANDLEFAFRLFGINEFLPNSALVKFLAEILCDTKAKFICENVIFLMCGMDEEQLNTTRLPVYISHSPAGTSTLNIVHFAQMVQSRKFQKFDFGKAGNMAKYGQPTPPEYNVANITTPIALFWGLNDWLADPADVQLLQPQIRNLITSFTVPYPKWAHLDFVWGIDASRILYPEVLKFLK